MSTNLQVGCTVLPISLLQRRPTCRAQPTGSSSSLRCSRQHLLPSTLKGFCSPQVLLSWLDTLEPPSRPRQKMLTNGSLVSLRDSPPASDSSKLTGSSSLESSQDEEERMGRSATLGRRVGERYTNHQQYGLPYSSVTLGRPARLGRRPRENNLFCDLDSRNNMLDTSNLSSNMLNNELGEERLRGR